MFTCAGHTIQEIADLFGCSASTFKTRLYRAREQFRQVYVTRYQVRLNMYYLLTEDGGRKRANCRLPSSVREVRIDHMN